MTRTDKSKQKLAFQRRLFICILSALCLIWQMAVIAHAEEPEQSDIEVSDTGDLKRGPRHYTFDFKANKGDWKIDEETGDWLGTWLDLPMLFPGDEVTLIPNIPNGSAATHDGECISGYVGMVFNDPDSAASRGPVEVTKTQAYGHTTESHSNVFIQEFKITGTEPVMVYSRGGGGYTSEEVENSEYANISLAYYAKSLSYNIFTSYCNINEQYINSIEGREFTEDEVASEIHYYTEAKNPTKMTYQDAFHNYDLNYDETKDLIYYNILHPYMEGYGIERVVIASSTENYDYKWLVYSFDRTAESWVLIPKWRNFGRSGTAYDLRGTYDDALTIRYEFSGKRTVTLDACGGTVEGYSSKVYDISGNIQLGKWAESAEAGDFTPVRKGYFFVGWYEDPECTTAVTSFKETVSKYSDDPYAERENRICRLYAKWQRDITGCSTSSIAAQTYAAKLLTPAITVTIDGKTLKKGTDYTVKYSCNKLPGTATVKITGIGDYRGTVTRNFTIKPRATTVNKLVAGTKSFTVTWGKRTTGKTTGYQIQYGTNKSFTSGTYKLSTVKNNTTIKMTVSKLTAGKTYYVRVRTYRNINGKNVYSAWSATKSVKVK